MSEQCIICLEHTSVPHLHHTVPQSRGGKNSLLITLCSTCHNVLHANASYICSQIRNKRKRAAKTFWTNSDSLERAQPYLEILVRAMLSPIPKGCSREHLLSTPVSTEVFEAFKFLQNDLGLSSQEQALQYCVKYTLSNKGIQQNEKSSSGSDSLWFMHIPKP